MEDILYPSKVELRPGASDHEATLVMEPFTQGYGTTIGNALRRAMLTSLPGAAITAVKLKGASHEFSSVPNIKEDVLEIMLNLKQVRLKSYSDTPIKLTMNVTGEKKVSAADFSRDAQVEIMNPDLHIATITDKKGVFELEVTIERGRGWRATEERGKEKMELGTIAIDALFSPVRTVGYVIEPVRVGDITNFDRLVMAIETDGTISPKEAVLEANNILLKHFNLLAGLDAAHEAAAPAADLPEAEVSETADVADEATSDEEKPKKSRKKAE